MSDVLLSYSREDEDKAFQVASALKDLGFSVSHRPPQVRDAQCVVILWSKTSINSTLVKDDARVGKDRKFLVQVSVDGVEPPVGFREFPCPYLNFTDVHFKSEKFRQFVTSVTSLVGVRTEGAQREAKDKISPPVTAPSARKRSVPEGPTRHPKPEGEPKPSGAKQTSPPRIFLSYRRDDAQGEAGRLHDGLIDAIGSDAVFMDVDSVPIGIDFVDYISEQLAGCAVMVAVIGPGWTTVTDKGGQRRLDDSEDLVRTEIAAALNRKIPVIPVLVRDASMPHKDALPDDLRALTRRNALPVSHHRWRHDVERLVEAIRRFLPEPTSGS